MTTSNPSALADLFDTYSRRARLAPALICLTPAIAVLAAWFPEQLRTWAIVVPILATCGLLLLISQFTRDRGKQREAALYAQWGGKPSVAVLRHRDERIDEITKTRYHSFLSRRLRHALPSAGEESTNPGKADRAYEAATAWLLAQSRDTSQFRVLFSENISYGFRRNLWGLKPIGLSISLTAAACSTGIAIFRFLEMAASPPTQVLLATAFAWFMYGVWAAVVTATWVRIPAEAYARQLIASCDTLAASSR